MAAKNLARTVVEGGRSSWSKYGRRKLARRGRRRWLLDDDGEQYQRKAPYAYREFADRLAPLRRWLESRAGRRWNEVYSEFCLTHDRRTMKGWHLWTHLRDYVCCTGLEHSEPYRFSRIEHGRICAEGGTLRLRPSPSYRSRPAQASAVSCNAAYEWAAGRRVIVRGKVLFWTAGIVAPTVVDPARPPFLERRPGMAQGRALEESEAAFWRGLPRELRAQLTYPPAACLAGPK